MSAPDSKAKTVGGSTRDRLIDAAFRVVARDGMEAASVKSIAAEAGIAPGLVHYHFANKDAVLEAALRRALEDYRLRSRERRAAFAAGDQIGALMADARAAVSTDADVFRVRLAFATRALTNPQLASVVQALNADAVEETALTFAAAAGRDHATEAERATAAVIKAIFDGVMLARLNDPSFPLERAADFLEQSLRAALAQLQNH